jgi:phage terminase small subunit
MDDNGGLKPVHAWPLIWRKGLVAGVEVEDLWEGRGESREHIGRLHKVKLSDRIKRLELIGKHIDVQAFKEKIEVAGALSLVVSSEDAGL